MLSRKPQKNFNKKYDVVSLFLIFEGKILLLKRQTGKSQEQRWGPPAGKVDEGEALDLDLVEDEEAVICDFFKNAKTRD